MMPSGRGRTAQAVATVFLALLLAGCQAQKQDMETPAFYRNLAQAGAMLDAENGRDMINAYRANNGLGSVSLEPRLNRMAQTYARALAEAARRGETIRPHAGQRDRLAAAGYGAGEVGEAIGAGYYTMAEAFSGWRDSPQHDRVMRLADADEMGIAAVYLPGTKYKVYWVLVMARRV